MSIYDFVWTLLSTEISPHGLSCIRFLARRLVLGIIDQSMVVSEWVFKSWPNDLEYSAGKLLL